MSEPKSSTRVTFPLALLFLIVTGASILAALLAPVIRDYNFDDLLADPFETVGEFLAAAIVGMLLGTMLGLFQFQRALGVIVGVALGCFLGPLCILLSRVAASQLVVVFPAVFIGCGILLIVAWFIRPPVTQIDDDPVRARLSDETVRGTK